MAARKKRSTKVNNTPVLSQQVAEALFTFMVRGVQLSSAEITVFNQCMQELVPFCSKEFISKNVRVVQPANKEEDNGNNSIS